MKLLFSFLCSSLLWGLLSLVGPGDAAAIHRRDAPFELRILPLGASITWGLLSTDDNGYRKALRDQLRYAGWPVNMVGSKSHGDMIDNDVEAKSGAIIDEVKAFAANSVGYKPNVVLINAGTNDCKFGKDIPQTGNRMRALIQSILDAEDMANTLIVLSTLLPSLDASTAQNVPAVNAQYRALVETMRGEGVSIILAEMNPLEGDPKYGWLAHPGDFADVTHPNDGGYKKMASIWYKAIVDAHDQGLIVEPAKMGATRGVCEKEPGDGIPAGGPTQAGSGEDDGIYQHDSEAEELLLEISNVDYNREDLTDRIFFARLWKDNRDDVLLWDKPESGSVRYVVFRNTGDFTGESPLTEEGYLSVKDNCNPAGVNFVDINGDGLDDFVCIGLDGTAFASVNNGDGSPSSLPSFTYLGKWKQNVGYAQARVRVGDVDGDGRADYCVLEDNGDMKCWRNGWINDVPKYWQPLGKRFTGKGMGDLRGVRLEDINGDGRADWLWVDEDGATTTYTNSRSCARGEEGDGLNIVWRQGFRKGESSGPTHPGMTGYDSSVRSQVHFARIWGAAQDFGLGARKDYVFIKKTKFAPVEGVMIFSLYGFKNVGSGATKIKADGNRYCNMMGHDDGRMDYVWILSKGDMRLYPNKGLTPAEFSKGGQSYWGPSSIVFDPKTAFGRDLDRRDLHLADFDGDGACDIMWTDPDNDNELHVWLNTIRFNGELNWEYHKKTGPKCPEKRGIGFFDRPVHLADLTGNGMADYLCVEPDGRTWGYIQEAYDVWTYMDQIKFAENRDRANLQWADVNGDGLADLIHTNKFNGDGTVWYNRGQRDIGGSRFWWEPKGRRYSGSVAGSCTYFPDLNGDGYADMHSITHSIDNTATTYYNGCSGRDHVGDDAPITDPALPPLPGEGDIFITFDPSCSGTMARRILAEFGYARDMAKTAQRRLTEDRYYTTFFSAGARADPEFQSKAKAVFGRVAEILAGDAHKVSVTCEPTAGMCNTADENILVSMDSVHMRLNVCPGSFANPEIASTKDRLGQCDVLNLRQAHRTWGGLLVHEIMHTGYAMSGETTGDTAEDYAHGYWPSVSLAAGTFDRSCTTYGQGADKAGKPLCVDLNTGKEGLCNADYSLFNADSWAFLAAALYFGEQCKKVIPPPVGDSLTRRADNCPDYSDEPAFDNFGRLGVRGYMHFGDSYAAGMGTGSQAWFDKCRVGSNNYGHLLQRWLEGEQMFYHNLPCSGDTTVGLHQKMEDWVSGKLSGKPQHTDLITLSIGGNDVFFSELIRNCVLTVVEAQIGWSGESYRQSCLETQAKAVRHMEDQSADGLKARLGSVYKRIMDNAAPNAHLYVTGYSGFFNHDTSDCDHTSFKFLHQSWDEELDDYKVYLTQSLRRELNDLVERLNTAIKTAISNANNPDWSTERVHFVDLQPHFDGHRWCEPGIREPDPDGQSWFFLNGWPDVGRSIGVDVVSRDVANAAQLEALFEAGELPLPDAATCKDALGTDPDPYDAFMCEIAIGVVEFPDSDLAKMVETANYDLAAGNLESRDIPMLMPLGIIKMFHPRTAGMELYRDAVLAKIREVAQFSSNLW